MLRDQISIEENVLLIDDVVITFEIKKVFITKVSSLVEIVFDNESHVAVRHVQVVSEYNEVVSLNLDSVSGLKAKLDIILIKICNFDIVRLEFASMDAIDNVIILSQIRIPKTVLEIHCIVTHIELILLKILLEIPNDHAIDCGRLFDPHTN